MNDGEARELLPADQNNTLLKSHLIRSPCGLIEHSSRGMHAWYTVHNTDRPAERDRSVDDVLFLFYTFISSDSFSYFFLCPFCWIFHILLFSGWINFNLNSKTHSNICAYFLSLQYYKVVKVINSSNMFRVVGYHFLGT